MADLFKEIMPSLMKKNTYVFDPSDKKYAPFIINRALSYHMDTLLFAAEVNIFPDVSPRMHYDYLFYSLPRRYRPFANWVKALETEQKKISAISKYYGYSSEKAKAALDILTDEQLQTIYELLDEGGRIG